MMGAGEREMVVVLALLRTTVLEEELGIGGCAVKINKHPVMGIRYLRTSICTDGSKYGNHLSISLISGNDARVFCSALGICNTQSAESYIVHSLRDSLHTGSSPFLMEKSTKTVILTNPVTFVVTRICAFVVV
jgi:hypothetical protein